MPFSNVSIVSADFMSFKDWSKEILGISSARKKMAVNLLEAGIEIVTFKITSRTMPILI